jgi:hypothetical protein
MGQTSDIFKRDVKELANDLSASSLWADNLLKTYVDELHSIEAKIIRKLNEEQER